MKIKRDMEIENINILNPVIILISLTLLISLRCVYGCNLCIHFIFRLTGLSLTPLYKPQYIYKKHMYINDMFM